MGICINDPKGRPVLEATSAIETDFSKSNSAALTRRLKSQGAGSSMEFGADTHFSKALDDVTRSRTEARATDTKDERPPQVPRARNDNPPPSSLVDGREPRGDESAAKTAPDDQASPDLSAQDAPAGSEETAKKDETSKEEAAALADGAAALPVEPKIETPVPQAILALLAQGQAAVEPQIAADDATADPVLGAAQGRAGGRLAEVVAQQEMLPIDQEAVLGKKAAEDKKNPAMGEKLLPDAASSSTGEVQKTALAAIEQTEMKQESVQADLLKELSVKPEAKPMMEASAPAIKAVEAAPVAAEGLNAAPDTVLPAGLSAAPVQMKAETSPAAASPAVASTREGVAVEVAVAARGGVRQIEIRLDPAEMGKIDVRLDVDQSGSVTTWLIVEKPETLDQLRKDAPNLQKALEEAGLKADSGSLNFSLRDQNQQQGQREHAPRDGLSHPDEAPAMPALAAHAMVYRGTMRGAGGVDLKL